MKQYKVEITKEALQDMEDIYNYIAIDLFAPDIRDYQLHAWFYCMYVCFQCVDNANGS